MMDFKYSCVVCVDDYKFELFKKTFTHYGLPIPMRVGELVAGQTPIQNCSHNHINCVKYAKEHDWPYVIIFEDDAFPRKDIQAQLELVFQKFNQLEFKDDVDLLYLAGYKCSGTETSSNHFKRCLSRYSSHAYVVFRKFYDKFISIPNTSTFNIGIDHIYKLTKNAYYYDISLFDQYTYKNTHKIHAPRMPIRSHSRFFGKFKPKWANTFDMKMFDDQWMRGDENNRSTVVIFNYFVHPKYSFTQNILDWYNSMKENYLVDCDRKFVIYTDNQEVARHISDSSVQFIYVDASTTEDLQENLRLKFKCIQDYLKRFNPKFDYMAFIQSNARCNEPIMLNELVGEGCDLAVCRHCSSSRGFAALYGDNRGTVADISKMDTSNFTYVHAGHFIFRRELLEKVCSFINQSIEEDRRNGTFTKWHDETYFNFYLNTVLMKDSSIKVNVINGRRYCRGYWLNNIAAKIFLFKKQSSTFTFIVPSQTNYIMNTHNLGDFIYSVCLRKFIEQNGLAVQYIKRNEIDKNHVLQLMQGSNDRCLLISGFFSRRESVTSFTRNAIGADAKYIGFYFHENIPSAVESKFPIGCRDISTFIKVSKSNPNSYVSLCPSLLASQVTSTYDNTRQKGKYVFVDCPSEFIKNTCSNLGIDESQVQIFEQYVPHYGRTQTQMEEAAFNRMEWIRDNAIKVFTTKIHIYLPCISLRVPCEFVGTLDHRTEITKIVRSDNIDELEPLIVQNFKYQLFGTGEDVHQKLHSAVMKCHKDLHDSK